MRFQVLKTGSAGNALLFEDDLLLDVGMSYNKLKEVIDVSRLKYVLLTHIHSDHYLPATIRKLMVNTKAEIVCGLWLADDLTTRGVPEDRIIIVDVGFRYELGGYTIAPVKAYHDVPNIGYRIMKDGHKHFHMTDTVTLDGISAENYDSCTLECNHCEEAIDRLIAQAKEKREFTHLSGAKNSHLSVQKAAAFVKQNKIKKFVPMHVGGSTAANVREHIMKEFKGSC